MALHKFDKGKKTLCFGEAMSNIIDKRKLFLWKQLKSKIHRGEITFPTTAALKKEILNYE